MSTYNGHKNWAYWNVALWIGNDEGLYNLARQLIRASKTKQEAAEAFVVEMHHCGYAATPDGANYSISAVRAAMVGLG